MTKKKQATKPAPKLIFSGRASQTQADNIKAWRKRLEPRSVAALSQKSGVSKETIYNMQNAKYDPLGPTEAIAQAFGKEAWMLLCPNSLTEIAEFIRVFNLCNEDDKIDMADYLEVIKKRIERRKSGATR